MMAKLPVCLAFAACLAGSACQTKSGGAAPPPEPPVKPAPAEPVKPGPAAPVRAEAALSATDAAARGMGTIVTEDRNSGYLLSAPHGGFDPGTDKVAAIFCAHVQWDCVIANGYRAKVHPINVNRPSEGAKLAASAEAHTERAGAVYRYYRSRVMAVRGTPLALYVELHDNERRVTAGHLEIATAGIDLPRAKRIKAIFAAELAAAHLTEVTALVEHIDAITMTASANKRFGIISEIGAPALHLEFPTSVLQRKPEVVAAMLEKALPRIAADEFPWAKH